MRAEHETSKRLEALSGKIAAVIVAASCSKVIRTSVLAKCGEMSGDQTLGLPKNLLLQDAPVSIRLSSDQGLAFSYLH